MTSRNRRRDVPHCPSGAPRCFTILVMWMPTSECGTTLGVRDGSASRISPHPCRRGTRPCPCSAAHSSNAPRLRTSGRRTPTNPWRTLSLEKAPMVTMPTLWRQSVACTCGLPHWPQQCCFGAALRQCQAQRTVSRHSLRLLPETLRSPHLFSGRPGRDLLHWRSCTEQSSGPDALR